MLRSYFLWRNFILLPEETEKRKLIPRSNRQNKCHFPPPLSCAGYWPCCHPWLLFHSQLLCKAGSRGLQSSAHSLGAVLQAGTLQAPRHTLQSPFVQGTPAPQALLLFKWPRKDKRTRDVILTPAQTQPQCSVIYQGLLASVWSSWLVPLTVENRFNLRTLLGSSQC